MRIALGITYDGYNYRGWQYQDNLQSTIQYHVENALSKVADQPIKVVCAGRTDAGVHALGQVIHFDTNVERRLGAWKLGTNMYLPHDIRVFAAQAVDENFHARFNAVRRSYRYVIYNQSVPSALLYKKITWYPRPLNVESMAAAGQYLIGEHDFSSFRAIECQAKTPIRHVYTLNIHQAGAFIFVDIEANAFLHHMVRNIVGVLLTVGGGKQIPEWMQQVLQARDRKAASITAPADGLYLCRVTYPAECGIDLPTMTPMLGFI